MRQHSFHIPHLKLHTHLRRSLRDLALVDSAYLDSLRNGINTSYPSACPTPTKHVVKKRVRISQTLITVLFDNSKGIFEEPCYMLANTQKHSSRSAFEYLADFKHDARIAAPIISHHSLELSDSRFSASIARYERKASIAARRETSEQLDPDRDLNSGLYLGSSEAMVNTLFNLSMPALEPSYSPACTVVLKSHNRIQSFRFRSPRLVLSRATRAARHKIHVVKYGQNRELRRGNMVCT